MTFTAEITDAENRYARLKQAGDPAEVRREIMELGGVLGLQARDIMTRRLGPLQDVLCVVVLRGGALMYPGFTAAFPHADFCILGMRRASDRLSVHNEYMTAVPRDTYQATIYIDCISATGGTVLATRKAVAAKCDTGHETAAVISSAALATQRLEAAGINLLGLSLYENLNGQVVMPDMGELDAGDLFSGVSTPPPTRDGQAP